MKRRPHRAGKQRNACASGKIRYRDRQSALQVLHGARNGSGAKDYIPVRAYECPECHGWHLSSKPDKFTREDHR